ncbi:MAG: hypothetical protein JSV59_02850 [Flavobacteriaceae bacterium]|nr:MAG: hypothetical protein JSV59_02850 [Flavobacteriaceae bacterium]
MKRIYLLMLFFVCLNAVNGQEIDNDLLLIKKRMDSIKSYEAQLKLDVDISFINMPSKYGKVQYKKGEPAKVTSRDFIMLPKRGLDLTLNELFKHPFITVNRGGENYKGVSCKVINLIPTSSKSQFSIATIFMDTRIKRIVKSEISTKMEGVFTTSLDYKNEIDVLPTVIEVKFAVNNVKIPLRFLGKETEVDRKAIKQEGSKSGKIFLTLSDVQIAR